MAAFAFASVASVASAADMPAKVPVVKKMPVAAPYSWTGFYLGVNGGVGGGHGSASATETLGGAVTGYDNDSERSQGFLLGGQIGYNHQFGNNVVAGVEADLDWANIKSDRRITISSVAAPTGQTTEALVETRALGTVRGRLGYAYGRILPYVTGGLAYAKIRYDFNSTDTSGYVASGSASAVRTGWTVGAGLEYALTRAMTFKTEYLYVDMAGFDIVVRDNAGFVNPTTLNRSSGHLVRVGANYHLGGQAGPEVAARSDFVPIWTGYHAGLNGGFGGGSLSGGANGYTTAGTYFERQEASDKGGGLFIGGQLGYDYRLSNGLVLGAEADLQWSDIQAKATSTYTAVLIAPSQDETITTKLKYFGTVRARLGYDMGYMLPYVTGGLAYGEWRATSNLVRATGYQSSGAADAMTMGWVVGVGLQYALSPSLSAKAEYLHVDLSGFNMTVRGNNGNYWPGMFDRPAIDIVRAGFDWRFGD